MKKIKFLCIGLCIIVVTSLLVSCKKINGRGDITNKSFTIANFTSIESSIDANIHITKSVTQSVEIVAQSNIIDNISLEVTGGNLKITFKKPAKDYDPININISMPNLSSLILSGSGNINTTNTFDSCGTVSIIISGSGNIDASFNSNIKTYSIISGSGNITLTGNSPSQDITISGSGNVHAFPFETYHSVVNLSGSGSCELSADSTLNVIISGSGNVNYKGHPVVNSTITGSGTIHNSN